MKINFKLKALIIGIVFFQVFCMISINQVQAEATASEIEEAFKNNYIKDLVAAELTKTSWFDNDRQYTDEGSNVSQDAGGIITEFYVKDSKLKIDQFELIDDKDNKSVIKQVNGKLKSADKAQSNIKEGQTYTVKIKYNNQEYSYEKALVFKEGKKGEDGKKVEVDKFVLTDAADKKYQYNSALNSRVGERGYVENAKGEKIDENGDVVDKELEGGKYNKISISTGTSGQGTLENPLDSTTLEQNTYKPSEESALTNLEAVGKILATINTIGVIISVIVLSIIGIKYMIGSVEEKAQYKETLKPYLLGVFMLAGGSTVLNVLYQLGKMLVI